MMMCILRTKSTSTKSNKDFLGLNDESIYPKTYKLYNFYTHKYVYLDLGNNIDDIDINPYHACDYELTDIHKLIYTSV